RHAGAFHRSAVRRGARPCRGRIHPLTRWHEPRSARRQQGGPRVSTRRLPAVRRRSMRWKWRLGLLLIAAVEVLFLFWISQVLGAPPEVILYSGGILALVLIAMLALRPFFFVLLGGWLGAAVSVACHWLRYLRSGWARGVGASASPGGAWVGCR